ncbi:vitellogenin-1-like isoform X2 [Trichosurus vulpecula]|uniref:vitellogenin-1-like isoform X2 n=1 Tax=Trichosurus vulpecula TaxID=9337 RepID=UPI00186B3B71|nr:vitellogenin-1-like isoform X2 [Trichosurus vulpecula]
MMRNLILLLLFVLSGLPWSQQVNYEPGFQVGQKYVYNYESILLSGLPEKGLGRTGISLRSKVEISGRKLKFPAMKMGSVVVADYNGKWPKDTFVNSPELTQALESQLAQSIKFQYSNGHVGDIYAPESMSENALNIYKGILNMLEVTIRKAQSTYSLSETGISGRCNTTYFIREDQKYNLVHITKSKDLNNCKESVQMNTGFAYAVKCKECKQPNRNSRSTSTSTYKIKISKGEPLIIYAEVQEIHQFTPFNELTGGEAVTQVWQKLELTYIQKASSENQETGFRNRGNLFYHFGNELFQMPVHLFEIQNIESQIAEVMEYLVVHMENLVPGEMSSKFLQLVQLFRMANVITIDSVWKKYADQTSYRNLFLDIIPAVASIEAIRFLRLKIDQQELNAWEAFQTVLLSLHFCTATQEAVDEAKLILKNTQSHPWDILRITGFLAYGSLVYKHCAKSVNCSESSLQPLHDFLAEASHMGDEEGMILALKSIGNAGHLASLKQIKKFLPGYSSGTSDLPIRIQIAAALSLRNIGKRNSKEVQEIAIYAFLEPNVPPQVRIVLSLVIFETIPGVPVLATMANTMLKERSLQVASFVFSQMKALGRSSAPEHRSLALACRLALRILKPMPHKINFSFKLSRSYYWDSFSELLMAGFALKYYSLNKAGSTLPPEIIIALKANFLGNTADILEFEMHTQEMLATILKKNLSRSDSYRVDDIKDFIKMLPDWKAIPSDKSHISLYLKLFGQEIFWYEFDKHAIRMAIQAFGQSEGRLQIMKKILDSLQNGCHKSWVKPLLFSEIRTIMPTSFGLPIERSFYFISVTSLVGNVQSQISPVSSANFRLVDLFNMNIEMHLKANLSIEEHIIAVMGVNTHLLQAVIEVYARMQADIPLDMTSSLDFKAQSFKFVFLPSIHDAEFAYISSKTNAITRNIGAPSSTRMTPVVGFYFRDSYQDPFNSTSASEDQRIKRVTPALDISEGNASRDIISPLKTVCYNMSTLGFQLCFLHTSISAAYIKPVPLYHVIGEHFIIVTVRPEPGIQKVQVAIQMGPEAPAKMVQVVHFGAENSSSEEKGTFEELEDMDKHMFLGDTLPPTVTAIARAIRTDNKEQGFQVTGYINSNRSKVDLQLVVVPLTDVKWKVCADATVLPLKTKGRLRWGMDCKNYKIEAQATVGQVTKKPVIQVKIDWGRLPLMLETVFKKIFKYISEIAWASGFSEAQGERTSHQAIFQAVATSSRTIHTVIKIPEVNFYYSTFPVPFALPVESSPVTNTSTMAVWNFLSEIAFLIKKEDEAQCEVSETAWKTFDGMEFKCFHPHDHELVVAKDCRVAPKFVVLTKKEFTNSTRKVSLFLGKRRIAIYPASSSNLCVILDDTPLLTNEGVYEDKEDYINIYQQNGSITILASEFGLEELVYDGKILKITISSWMREKTCGICGKANWEVQDELEMPNQKQAHDCTAFFHAWLLVKKNCDKGKMMQMKNSEKH